MQVLENNLKRIEDISLHYLLILSIYLKVL